MCQLKDFLLLQFFTILSTTNVSQSIGHLRFLLSRLVLTSWIISPMGPGVGLCHCCFTSVKGYHGFKNCQTIKPLSLFQPIGFEQPSNLHSFNLKLFREPSFVFRESFTEPLVWIPAITKMMSLFLLFPSEWRFHEKKRCTFNLKKLYTRVWNTRP